MAKSFADKFENLWFGGNCCGKHIWNGDEFRSASLYAFIGYEGDDEPAEIYITEFEHFIKEHNEEWGLAILTGEVIKV